ncbi:ATP-dependent Clp protease proteolytic subunit [Enterococcus hulanensis]|uniref:Clp protease ClpP n=1 Tax=Enterococcus hulanensis TaxID=2559929 RepID=UPI001A8CC1D9|nr:Clp protease ClpP [Enterococcus hulanensis]MBO0459544.1 ATP-dependent Clp protease proteolytic subunit [Enterococcus hulanensis]
MVNLRLSGVVGYEITANGIAEFLNKNDDKDVTIFLNSPGGIVTEGLEVYNLLRASGRNITTVLTGMAASMGSIIFLAGDRRIAMTGSLYMVHKPSGLVWGDADEMHKEIEVLNKMQDSAEAIYRERTGIGNFHEYMNRESWFDTKEMKELGISNSEDNVTFELETNTKENADSLNLESEEEMAKIDDLKAEKEKLEAEKAELNEKLEEARLEAEVAMMKADVAKLKAEAETTPEPDLDPEPEKEPEEDNEPEDTTDTDTDPEPEEDEGVETVETPEPAKETAVIDTTKTVAKKSNNKIPAFMQAESKY